MQIEVQSNKGLQIDFAVYQFFLQGRQILFYTVNSKQRWRECGWNLKNEKNFNSKKK